VKILADENVDRPLVEWLRQAGHDVSSVAELHPGRDDSDVLAAATADDRIVITFDLDYGGLVYRRGIGAAGVVLLRLRSESADRMLSLFRERWPAIEKAASGNFVVVTNRRLRIRPLPRDRGEDEKF
jgi:predicted nuclease of predicted toxin-antitoxin system